MMQFRLVENDPAAWSTSAPVERTVEDTTEARRRPGMPWLRSGACRQLAIDDLGDEVRRNGQQILVRRAPLCGQ